jgi:hypothetical protein
MPKFKVFFTQPTEMLYSVIIEAPDEATAEALYEDREYSSDAIKFEEELGDSSYAHFSHVEEVKEDAAI